MKQVLIIGNQKVGKVFGQLLVPRYAERYVHCEAGAKARRFLSQYEFDLVIIDSKLPDELADSLSHELAFEYKVTVIVLGNSDADSSSEGVIALKKPVELPLLEQTLYTIRAAHIQLEALKAENRRLKKQLDESRLVGRAKCVLVAHTALSESEAHRYIEKVAMDSRMPKRDVAQDILQKYQD